MVYYWVDCRGFLLYNPASLIPRRDVLHKYLIHDNIAESLANHTVLPLFSVKIEQERKELTNVIANFLNDKNLIAKA